MTWFHDRKLEVLSTFDSLSPLGRASKKYARYASGKFIWEKPLKYGLEGLEKAMYAGEVAVETSKQVGKGLLKMIPLPPAILASSRLVAIKRFLWDVPLATVSAAIRLPIALAKSPGNMVEGVRQAIRNVPKNANEIFNSVRNLNVWDTITNTRDALAELMFPPVRNPVGPVLEPAYAVGKEIYEADIGQTVQKVREDIPSVFMSGLADVRGSVTTARGIVDGRWAEREAKKAERAKLKEAKEAFWRKKVKEHRGEFNPDDLKEAATGKK